MSTSRVREITEQSFETEVIAASVPVLVDFTATWCAPCRALAPILEKVAELGRDQVKVVTVNGEDCPSIAIRLGVKAYPTVIVFRGGKEVARHVGLTTKEKLLKMVV